MPIDQSKLKEFEEDLAEKGNGPSSFLNASKMDKAQEFRILDPLPNMDGLYALEVNFWWVGKTKVNTPGVLTGEDDQVQIIVDEAKASGDEEMAKLLDKRDKYNKPSLRKQTEYWIPGLAFDWEFDEKGHIMGIWNDDDSFNVAAVAQYVRDGAGKILTTRIQLMKAINRIATARGGSEMFDQENGFNLNLGRVEEKSKITYTALKSDVLPMPAQFYGEGTPDVVNICKGSMFTDDYIYRLMGEYLYGEKLEDRVESDYRYPEIRASLKKDAPAEESKPSRPQRGTGVRSSTAPAEDTKGPAEQEEQSTEGAKEPKEGGGPVRPSSSARQATPKDVEANTTRAPGPTRGGGRGGRSMTDDMKDV
ncbi:hypothetical protein LCGC14_0278750 [marine sediment metagenome]|uniref:Uncharacterized protein n=1 Tax=marine sediment metagenome TaxID=412755 RepID=A0A0F9UDT3_9ZZZZ